MHLACHFYSVNRMCLILYIRVTHYFPILQSAFCIAILFSPYSPKSFCSFLLSSIAHLNNDNSESSIPNRHSRPCLSRERTFNHNEGNKNLRIQLIEHSKHQKSKSLQSQESSYRLETTSPLLNQIQYLISLVQDAPKEEFFHHTRRVRRSS